MLLCTQNCHLNANSTHCAGPLLEQIQATALTGAVFGGETKLINRSEMMRTNSVQRVQRQKRTNTK